MLKRGQVSIIILTGLVLLIAVSFILYTNQQAIVEAPAQVPSDPLAAVETMLHDCWQTSADHVATTIGIHGGSMLPEFLDDNTLVRPGVQDGRVTLPTRDELEEELSIGTSVLAAACEDGIVERAASYGVTLELGDLDVKATLTPDSVLTAFSGDYLLKTTTATKRISAFSHTTMTPLGKSAALAHYLAGSAVIDGTLDVLTVRGTGADVRVLTGATSVKGVEITAYGPSPSIPSLFYLAFDQTNDKEQTAPLVEPLGPITAPVDTQTLGLVQARDPQGGPLTYDAYSPLVNIDKDTGAFEIRPTAEMRGDHAVVFRVTNTAGESTEITAGVTVI